MPNAMKPLFLPFLLLLLPGCGVALVGGAATTAALTIDRRSAGSIVEDQAIEWNTMRALLSDDHFSAQKTHVNVTSYNGLVLLTGEVPSEALRDFVVDTVRNLKNDVKHVHNEINVAAPSTLLMRGSDSLLTSQIKAKMLVNNALRKTLVKVVSEKGVVYLMGLVTREEAEAATDIARRTNGVQQVVQLFEYVEAKE